MTIHVRLFAHMAAAAGAGSLTLDLPDDADLSALRPALEKKFPKLPWPPGTMLAVNQEYSSVEAAVHPLNDGDEVAIIPPVSGGTPRGARKTT